MIRIVISNAIYLSIPSSQNQWMSKVGNPSRDPFLENLGTIAFVHNLGTWLILPSKIPGGSSKWRFQSCQPWISEKLSVKKIDHQTMEPLPIIRRNIDILPYFLCQSLKIIQETTISLESHRIKMVSSAFQPILSQVMARPCNFRVLALFGK